MMTLELMKNFFETVTSDGHCKIADKIVAKWLNEVGDVSVWRASANFVFSVETSKDRYFLRFNHANERNTEVINAEIDYINHLKSHGVRIAEPILSTSDNYVESVSTEMGEFHAVLFQALTGEDWEFDSLDERQFELWGKALGEMHSVSKMYNRDHRPTWRDHIQVIEKVLPISEENARNELLSVKKILNSLPSSADEFGLIHFDFEQDNLKWMNDEAGIMDFDDCALYWFEADIAFALRDLFEDSVEKIDFKCERLGAFLNGYRSEMQITETALKRIPLFLRVHNLVTYVKLIRTLGDEPVQGEPKWMADLRNRLTNKCLEYQEQFVKYPISHFVG